MTKTLFTALGAVAMISLAGCASGSAADRAPNEFNVVTKAPLTVPPEYKLRPPSAGTTLPAEVDPARADVATAFGTNIGQGASLSERALVAYAGANSVNPLIRNQVDYEEAKTLRKNTGVVDRILFWRGDKQEDVDSGLDDNATGGQPVAIERTGGNSPRLKLPGT